MIDRMARAVRASMLRCAWAAGLYEPPDRRLLDRILEHYAGTHGFERILFVGCKKYNAKHRALFADRAYTTIDPNPEVARFGGSRHIVGRIEDAETHLGHGSVDLVVINGVIGFGLDDPAAMERAFAACHAILRPGGQLVLGINELLGVVDLATVKELARFAPFAFAALGADRVTVTTPFRERTHTFAFYQRR